MRKIFLLAISLIAAGCWICSCSSTETYAELVEDEKQSISEWIKGNPYDIEFGHIINKDEEWVEDVADYILEDSIHPAHYIELGQWYKITEGNFKRLYFRINSFGDGLDSLRAKGAEISDEQERAAMRNHKKFFAGKNVLVRYDSLYLISDFDYDDLDENSKGDNLDPNSFMICYNWNRYYYYNSYYSYQYSNGSSYECTSGGIGFPVRFLWEGGNASIICPFSLVESTYSSYYYTLYYGTITYTKPNYLPQ